MLKLSDIHRRSEFNLSIPDHPVAPDFLYQLFAIVVSVTLLIVFVSAALAFILLMFGKLKPQPAVRNALVGTFGASTLGLFITIFIGYFNLNPLPVKVAAAREAITENNDARNAASAANAPKTGIGSTATQASTSKVMTIYTQVETSSDYDMKKYQVLRNSLPRAEYAVTPVDVTGIKVGKNEIRYCNPVNQGDAEKLSTLLLKDGYNPPAVTQIRNCNGNANLNILEVWLQSGR